MRRQLSVDEIKCIELEILENIDRFCRNQNLRYSLAYGTLIGAIRHKGFIPWDDDIDLMMPRPDYDLFRKEFKAEGLYLTDLAERDDCVETFLKVCKEGTIMVEKSFGRELWGVNVDIFPIDGAPSDKLEDHYAKLDMMREELFRICPYYKSVKKRRFLLILKYVLKRIRYINQRSFMSLKRELVYRQKLIPYETAETVGIYFASEKTRTFLWKRVYDEIGTLSFEGSEYSALRHFDEYLTQLYGNYMQLPPKEKRVFPHPYDSFIE